MNAQDIMGIIIASTIAVIALIFAGGLFMMLWRDEI